MQRTRLVRPASGTLAVVAVALGALLLAPRPAAADRPGKPDPGKVYAVPVASSPQRGTPDARLTIVMFSELGCPFCARVQPTLAQLQQQYGKDVRVVWKSFVVHGAARPTHLVAAAAAAQGKFWPFHDRFLAWYEKHSAIADEAQARQLAADAGVDLKQADAYIASGKAAALVDADELLRKNFGVSGAPTFFINGRVLTGAQPLEKFTALCDEELKKAKTLQAQHPRALVYDQVMASGERQVPMVPDAAPGTPSASTGPRPGRPDPARTYAVPVAASPVKGDPDAKITIIEFGEFKCPYCDKVQPTLAAIEKKYGKDVRFVWKNMVVHVDTARPIARAAAAVNAQGKFWQFAARVWPDWKSFDEAKARKLAGELGCDLKQYDQYLAAKFADGDVDADIRLARQFGVTGTPTFFINGRVLTGAQPQAAFEALIDEELKKADAWRQGGGKGAVYDHILSSGDPDVPAAP